MQSARLDASQDGVKIAQRNINNLRYADDTTLMAESKEELKSLLMRTKEDSDKTGLKNFFFLAFNKLRSWHLVPSLHGKWMGKKWKPGQILFSCAPKSLRTVTESQKNRRFRFVGAG